MCDRERRVLAAGRGVFELSGTASRSYSARRRRAPRPERLERRAEPAGDRDSSGASRRSASKLQLRTRAGQTKAVTADFFPAYDEDGGLLVGTHAARLTYTSVT
jgi:hypothetical protein